MINVIYTSMDNYSPFLGISMLSLFENNKNEQITVYVLSNNIKEENISLLRKIAGNYGQNIGVVDVETINDKFGIEINTGGFSMAALIRLFSASYLPESAEKALYIDCDTVIEGSIRQLWETDIDDYYVGAVVDFAMPYNWPEKLGLPIESLYFNAGVQLMNLKKWRQDNLEQKFIDYYREKDGYLQYADQDVMNYCCYGKIREISVRYNFAPNMRFYPSKYIIENQKGYGEYTVEELNSIKKSPVIIHYMGDERPWVKWNHNAYRKYYDKYKKISPWKNMEMKDGSFAYMQAYWLLNHITMIAPRFRKSFFENVGIHKYKLFGKK